jgi:hypothetical protein
MRLTGRRISLLVICAICVFGTVGCGRPVVRKGIQLAQKHSPEVKKAAKELWEQAPGVAKEGGKKLGEEGLKQAPRKYEEYKRENKPKTFTPQPSFTLPKQNLAPLTKEQEKILKKYELDSKSLDRLPESSVKSGK